MYLKKLEYSYRIHWKKLVCSNFYDYKSEYDNHQWFKPAM